jgi:hypothetical protein
MAFWALRGVSARVSSAEREGSPWQKKDLPAYVSVVQSYCILHYAISGESVAHFELGAVS